MSKGAGRPIKQRTIKTYESDVQHLSRVRASLLMDMNIDSNDAKEAIVAIDNLVSKLLGLREKLIESS
jgi:phosphoribosylformylglycinamidine (FGAM) synthase PurS component